MLYLDADVLTAAILYETWIVNWNYNSLIHYGNLYSASSRLLLRSAPDSCTAKEQQFWGWSRMWTLRSNRCANGSPFYAEGPTTEIAKFRYKSL